MLGLLLSACARAPLPAPADGGVDMPPASHACVRCDAVINPCPALGLICLPAAGVCVPEEIAR